MATGSVLYTPDSGYRGEQRMRKLTDETGRRWMVERVGRTSGIVPPKPVADNLPEPADIIRFSCVSDHGVPARETATRAGLLEEMSEVELRALLNVAPRAPTE
jgi:hypothetical protein